VQWSVPDRIAVLEGSAAVLFGGAAVLTGDLLAGVVAGGAALLLAGLAVRDRLARVRLAADHDGVTVVRGFAQRRRIPWSEIVAVRVEERSRYGRSARLLEIDTGERVHLLSGRELGADPADVVAALDELRS